ncbi:MAG TPA: hypothetical protein VFV41_12610 [Streptosporangiaceae bacterium]|nr:hypothetical protein [Streptosporangiaceae bacterium]
MALRVRGGLMFILITWDPAGSRECGVRAMDAFSAGTAVASRAFE